MTDEEYMKMALKLSYKGIGHVNPNPLVGAVIVKNERVIGTGFHERCGGAHAEINAIADCIESPEGATLYITLEPCCHYGRTPPCTEAVIKAGIRRVIIGCRDENELVSGKGADALRKSSIEVNEGVLEKECREANRVFFHYIKTKMPYVVMKYGMTADGKIASRTGKSKWITCEKSRIKVHEDRNRYTAIMVGSGTVIKDDPLLTCRIEAGRNPMRIICDTDLNIPLNSKIISTAADIPTIIATSCNDENKRKIYEDAGCRIVKVSLNNGHINLKELMKRLGCDEIDSILLEGGGTINWSMLEAGLVNRINAYISPKLMGGSNAYSPVAGLGAEDPDKAFKIKDMTISLIGSDILLEGDVENKCSLE